MVVSIVPKGCTQYWQSLDTLVFSIFKNYYQAASDEYIDCHGSRNKMKLSGKQKKDSMYTFNFDSMDSYSK